MADDGGANANDGGDGGANDVSANKVGLPLPVLCADPQGPAANRAPRGAATASGRASVAAEGGRRKAREREGGPQRAREAPRRARTTPTTPPAQPYALSGGKAAPPHPRCAKAQFVPAAASARRRMPAAIWPSRSPRTPRRSLTPRTSAAGATQ
jgi:hypothetical protein